MRVLVTGGTGFVGSNIALALQARGDDVIATGAVYEQHPPELAGKILFTGLAGIDWEKMGAIDALCHQAAIADTTIRDRDEMLRANVENSKTLFRDAIAHGAKCIVYASSTAVYGNSPPPYREAGLLDPLNPYAESKALLDEYAMAFANEHPGIRIVGLRYCNVYGPRENHKKNMASMVYQLARQMQAGNPKLFKHGEQKREYIYINDVVRANLLALEARESCVVNCATGRARTFNELVDILNATLGLARAPEYIDNPFGDTYQSRIECDVSLAKQTLGFAAQYDLESGVRAYYESGFLTR